ncbi:unnamed protein product [Scytosiphon promiscuus]
MQENAYLSYFFGCVGFLPLTDESQIREAMVKIMVPAVSRPELPYGTDFCGEEEHFVELGAGGTHVNVPGTNLVPQDSSCCTFWCAVAVGALAKGSPIESVERYSQLAREALVASRSGSTDAELAKASASLAYLHSFMGDRAKFNESLELSEAFLRASTEEESSDLSVVSAFHVELCISIPGVVCRVTVASCRNVWWWQGNPALDNVATEGDLYQFVAQSFRAFDQAIYAKARRRCAGDLDHYYSDGPSHRNFDPDDPLLEEVSEAMAEVLRTESSLDFEPLQEAVDRPRIRAGIGGLLINGVLVFEMATKGDLVATLERLSRSVEVYERYPGLCRCMVGSHMAHIFLTTLAAIGDFGARDTYNRLRRVYNSCRLSKSVPIPPLDEWEGMEAVCGDLQCMAVGTLVKSDHMKAFTALSVDSGNCGVSLTQADRDPHGLMKTESFPANFAHEESASLVPGSSRNSWAKPNAAGIFEERTNPAGATSCGSKNVAHFCQASPFCSDGHSCARFALECGVAGVSIRNPASIPRPAGICGCHRHVAESEDDEVGAADWLEASYAMRDEVHGS